MPEDDGIMSSKCGGEITVNLEFYTIIQELGRNRNDWRHRKANKVPHLSTNAKNTQARKSSKRESEKKQYLLEKKEIRWEPPQPSTTQPEKLSLHMSRGHIA